MPDEMNEIEQLQARVKELENPVKDPVGFRVDTPVRRLNADLMQRFYEFGGIYVFQPQFVDPVMVRIVDEPLTFNEEEAKARVAHHQSQGRVACYIQHLVKFDGAFSAFE